MNSTRFYMINRLSLFVFTFFRTFSGFRETIRQQFERSRTVVRVVPRDKHESAEFPRKEFFFESSQQREPHHISNLQERHRQSHHRGGGQEHLQRNRKWKFSEEKKQEEVHDHHQQPSGRHGSHQRSSSKNGELKSISKLYNKKTLPKFLTFPKYKENARH